MSQPTVRIVAPLAGDVIDLTEVPDPVFASKKMGDGFGVVPSSGAVVSPASGKVMMKAGFVYDHEAVYHKFDGTAIPCKCYALTREHYESLYSPNE